MSATVRLGIYEATIDGWEWSSDEQDLAAMLNASLDPEGPSGSDPNSDYHEALRVAERYGGEVLRYDKSEYDKDTVY